MGWFSRNKITTSDEHARNLARQGAADTPAARRLLNALATSTDITLSPEQAREAAASLERADSPGWDGDYARLTARSLREAADSGTAWTIQH